MKFHTHFFCYIE